MELTADGIRAHFRPVMSDGAMRQLWRDLEAAGCIVSRDHPDADSTALWRITVTPPPVRLRTRPEPVVVLYEQRSNRFWHQTTLPRPGA